VRTVVPEATGVAASIDHPSINTIRNLAMDAVQRANSGHPDAPTAFLPGVAHDAGGATTTSRVMRGNSGTARLVDAVHLKETLMPVNNIPSYPAGESTQTNGARR
jgi:fructose-1,6-bisphosphatase/sedoheptulose 1,7-bisphosphatase-like protein